MKDHVMLSILKSNLRGRTEIPNQSVFSSSMAEIPSTSSRPEPNARRLFLFPGIFCGVVNGFLIVFCGSNEKLQFPCLNPISFRIGASIPLNNSVAAATGVSLSNPYGISSTSSASLLRRGRQRILVPLSLIHCVVAIFIKKNPIVKVRTNCFTV
ncbi:pectin lyase-like superfamily protein [Striga asiatica]|uniref:Pectin lyase-like superfamily protein n=1 Tax=Striga asiatica TaxID=4170 RepID=A0A5A7PV98_STRAF|nr:pectin lyase-like superfamily protein [Striga asiatica]